MGQTKLGEGSNNIYQLMIKEVQSCNDYMSLNGRDILDFPLHVPMGCSIEDFLKDTFDKYYKLLEKVSLINSMSALDIESVKNLGDKLLDTLEMYREGMIVSAYEKFVEAIVPLFGNIPTVHLKHNGQKFYRMRSEKNLKESKDFFPLPFRLRYLSSSCRFSIAGSSAKDITCSIRLRNQTG